MFTSEALITTSGCTASADIFNRSELMSTRMTRPARWTPRAMRTCRQPMGPAPKITTSSPGSILSCSWALMAQAKGSAAEASAKPTPSGMRFMPSTANTSRGTIMYSAKPPSYW